MAAPGLSLIAGLVKFWPHAFLLLAAQTRQPNWTTQQDHQNMKEQLGIKTLRPETRRPFDDRSPRSGVSGERRNSCRTKSADKSDALQTLRACVRVNGPRGSVWSACVFSAAFPKQAAIRWPGMFMEIPLSLFRMHRDHEPAWVVPSVRCPAFRRSVPAKGGTPNGWFMESLLSFLRMHWDHEPCGWSAELLFGTMAARRRPNTAPNWSSALRFMERPVGPSDRALGP